MADSADSTASDPTPTDARRAQGDGPESAAHAAAPDFSERLWPSLGVWAIIPVLGLLTALAAMPIGITVAVVAAVAVSCALTLWAVVASPRIEVVGGYVRAERARIEVSFVGPAESFRDQAAVFQRGPGLDARAFVVFRGWINPVVRIPLTDASDPTPYWLISTRRPEEFVAALDRARAR